MNPDITAFGSFSTLSSRSSVNRSLFPWRRPSGNSEYATSTTKKQTRSRWQQTASSPTPTSTDPRSAILPANPPTGSYSNAISPPLRPSSLRILPLSKLAPGSLKRLKAETIYKTYHIMVHYLLLTSHSAKLEKSWSQPTLNNCKMLQTFVTL